MYSLINHQLIRDCFICLPLLSSSTSSLSSSHFSVTVMAADRRSPGSSKHRRNKQEIKDRTNREAREKAEKEAMRQARGVGTYIRLT